MSCRWASSIRDHPIRSSRTCLLLWERKVSGYATSRGVCSSSSSSSRPQSSSQKSTQLTISLPFIPRRTSPSWSTALIPTRLRQGLCSLMILRAVNWEEEGFTKPIPTVFNYCILRLFQRMTGRRPMWWKCNPGRTQAEQLISTTVALWLVSVPLAMRTSSKLAAVLAQCSIWRLHSIPILFGLII